MYQVKLNSAVGPHVVYPQDMDAQAVEAELPVGWEVDYSSQVRTDSGHFSAPLVLSSKPKRPAKTTKAAGPSKKLTRAQRSEINKKAHAEARRKQGRRP